MLGHFTCRYLKLLHSHAYKWYASMCSRELAQHEWASKFACVNTKPNWFWAIVEPLLSHSCHEDTYNTNNLRLWRACPSKEQLWNLLRISWFCLLIPWKMEESVEDVELSSFQTKYQTTRLKSCWKPIFSSSHFLFFPPKLYLFQPFFPALFSRPPSSRSLTWTPSARRSSRTPSPSGARPRTSRRCCTPTCLGDAVGPPGWGWSTRWSFNAFNG